MLRFFALSSALLALVGVFYLLRGVPVPELDYQLPEDWQRQLPQSEAAFDDMRPGLQKSIVWHDPERQEATPLALLYLHGFFASKGELEPVVSELASALGANVFFTRLQGHGRSDAALAEASLQGWLRDTQEAWEIATRLGERVVIIGASTGGTLATWLAHAQADDPRLHALALFSPNFHPRPVWGTKLVLLPGGLGLARLLLGANTELPRYNDLQRLYWNTSYPVAALLPMMQTVRMVENLDLSIIATPTLMFYSERDRVVDSALAERRWQELGSPQKRKLALETHYPGNHILAGDAYSPENNAVVLAELLDFLGAL